jgi:hypothetical protein
LTKYAERKDLLLEDKPETQEKSKALKDREFCELS